MSSITSKTPAQFSRDALDAEQERIVAHIHAHPSCAVWVEMGELGKTLPVLTALAELLEGFDIGKVLVVATKRIANDTWHAEIEKWDHLRHLSYSLVVGNVKARRAALDAEADVYVTNRDNVVWLVNEVGKRWPFDALVLDESTSFKNPSSKRFRALKRILHRVDRVIEMTGTPAANGYLDLWAQVYLLDRGERLGKTFTAFKQRFFDSDWYGYSWTLKPGAAEDIQERISDLCLRVEVPEHLRVPYDLEFVLVDLPSEIRAEYDELERNFLLELDEDGAIVEAPSATGLHIKLMQLANGAIYYREDDGPRQTSIRHSAKLDRIKAMIDDADSPVILAYTFESDRDRVLSEVPGALLVTSPEYKQSDWDARRIPVLVGHPKSFGHGLNLQYGGHNTIWFGVTYDLEHFRQLNRRQARRGQRERVRVRVVIARDTIEEDVVSRLRAKESTERDLFAAMVDGARRRAETAERDAA